jgi:fibronectin-binding autotransporter adhesin
MLFNSSFVNPSAYFRGTNGASSRVGTWTIGDGYGTHTSFASATNDFSLGTVNALVNTMYVGKGASTTFGSGASALGIGTLIMNAGTLDVNFLNIGYGLTAAGTGTVDINGGSLVVNSNLLLGFGGGSGTLSVSGATVSANNGITAGSGSSAISLLNAVLNVNNNTAAIGTPAALLTQLTMQNSTLTVSAQTDATNVVVNTLDPVTGSPNTIIISSVAPLENVPAQFPIISYQGNSGDLTTFVLGPLPAGYFGYISNDTTSNSIDLVITSGPIVPPLIWNGSPNGNWDTTTSNWTTNGGAAVYQQGYAVVEFTDALTGTSNVNLTTLLTPGSLTVNNSLSNYIFTGTGSIGGATGLAKSGTASLTLDQSGSNSFTGAVAINGGTLQIGNGDNNGNLPLVNVSLASSASLTYDQSGGATVPNVISGSGTLNQNGAGILALTGSNIAFTGAINVNNGTLQGGNTNALGTPSAINISSGGTFDVNAQAYFGGGITLPITVIGAGVNNNGAIINSGTNQSKVLHTVTLNGDASFGGVGDWDIRNSIGKNSGADATLAGAYNLTIVGPGTVTLTSLGTFSAENINITGGTLDVADLTVSLGDPSATVTVSSNATLTLDSLSNPMSKFMVLNGGATLQGTGTNMFTGTVSLAGIDTISAGTGAQLTLGALVSGSGQLSKNGAGMLVLTYADTYTGTTLINGGTLALQPSGSIADSTNINVTAGATLDVSALTPATLDLSVGQTLSGSGTVFGSVAGAGGSFLAPGTPATTGTLTITNVLTLLSGDTTTMKINQAAGSNDMMIGMASVTYGGTLTVTGIGGVYVAGTTYQLFSALAYNGSFSTINLPTNVVWNISNLGVNGTIQIVSVLTPSFSSIGPIATNMFPLVFSGPAGDSWRLWDSTNVALAPVTNTWTLVTNGIIGASGRVTLTNSTTNVPALFYEVTTP